MKFISRIFIIPCLFTVASLTSGCNSLNAKVALVTDVGDIDDGSFNQSSWEAINEYCSKNNQSCDYYRPFADSDFARNLAVKQAVAHGAEIIICPGFKFASTVTTNQALYPNVHFVLIDAATNGNALDNTVCVTYQEHISGYLAGISTGYDYAEYDLNNGGLVSDYKFGYCGGVPYASVYPFGYGFVQGLIDGICKSMEKHNMTVNDFPNLNVKYTYSGVFVQDDATAARMMDWYSDGVKAVFACGGKLYQSVTEGVKDYNKKNNFYNFKEGETPRDAARWVGVDTDQYSGLKDDHEKKTIITSAQKGIKETINTSLTYHFDNQWDVIGGAYNVPRFDSEEEAEKYINENKELFDLYDYTFKKSTNENYSNKFEIYIKNKNDSDDQYIVYQQKINWTLGLGAKFGREDIASKYGIEIAEQDFVSIPNSEVTHDDGHKSLRGFNIFSLDDYKESLSKLKHGSSDYVYGFGGSELLEKDNDEFIFAKNINDGYPTFMSKSDQYYVASLTETGAVEYKTFNEKYFRSIDPKKINVEVI